MSFGYPPVKGRRINPANASVNVSQQGFIDTLSNGFNVPVRDSLEVVHPLEQIENNRPLSEFQRDMNLLRNVQGIHAPLRICMELKMFDNVGHLPFLPSCNLSKDVLLGHDSYIDFSDVLNPVEVHERLERPHIVMERKLGIL